MNQKEMRAAGAVSLSEITGTPVKLGVASEDMAKLIDCLRDELPEEYVKIAIRIIHDCSTRYF
jgi:hypothetical protein